MWIIIHNRFNEFCIIFLYCQNKHDILLIFIIQAIVLRINILYCYTYLHIHSLVLDNKIVLIDIILGIFMFPLKVF